MSQHDDLTHLNKEAQELLEIFNVKLEELSSQGNTKVVDALITLGHIMSKDVQILREEYKLLLKGSKMNRDAKEKRRCWFDNYKEVYDDVPACPYCFHEFEDWWECFKNEDGYDTELECGWCEETFSAKLHIAYSFTTKRKGQK